MPRRCCIPFCKGNYPKGPKVATFTFPSNEIHKKKRLEAIQRKDFIPSKHSRVSNTNFVNFVLLLLYM